MAFEPAPQSGLGYRVPGGDPPEFLGKLDAIAPPLNSASTFRGELQTLLYSNGTAATLTDGAATFVLAYTLAPGTSYVLKVQATDRAGNVGTSAATPISVVSSIWSLNTTQAVTSDPLQGDALLRLGNVHREHALDIGQSSDLALLQVNGSALGNSAEVDVSLTPLQSPTTPASLVYNSDSVAVRPVSSAVRDTNHGRRPLIKK